jgi:hypothetical protein
MKVRIVYQIRIFKSEGNFELSNFDLAPGDYDFFERENPNDTQLEPWLCLKSADTITGIAEPLFKQLVNDGKIIIIEEALE